MYGWILFNILRSKWIFYYAIILFVFSSIVINSGSGQFAQSIISVLNLSLLIVPLFSLLYGTISFSEALSFMELILIRNISRTAIFWGKFISLSLGLSLSYLVAILLSLLFLESIKWSFISTFLSLIILVCFLHFIFIALSYLLAVLIKRKELMLGVALILWFYFYIFYDVLILFVVKFFRDYPLEYPLFAMILLNPIDLIRISVLLQLDISNVMGFSTAFHTTYIRLFLWYVIKFIFSFSLFSCSL